MTRINLVPVTELSRQHLMAEYREIMRLPKNIKTSLNRKSKAFSLTEIPPQYVLGKGHVKFFFNKMGWVKNRFEQLVQEMNRRGYTTNYTDSTVFDNCPTNWRGSYTPTEQALELNRQRIKERS